MPLGIQRLAFQCHQSIGQLRRHPRGLIKPAISHWIPFGNDCVAATAFEEVVMRKNCMTRIQKISVLIIRLKNEFFNKRLFYIFGVNT
jgi:hypothetical protein